MASFVKISRGDRDDCAVLVDDAGVRRLWPRIKTQLDVESVVVLHEVEPRVRIVEVAMTPDDYAQFIEGVSAAGARIHLG